MWEEGVKLRSICWQGSGLEGMAGGGVLELGTHLNACIHQPMSCWVEMSWTSPHLSWETTHMLYTCVQHPGSASIGPFQEGDLLLLISHQSQSACAEEGHSKC